MKRPAEFVWVRRHLIGLQDLSPEEITFILDQAEAFKEVSTRSIKKVPALRGKVVVNLFFEESTRTRTSFSLAAGRLSADVVEFAAAGSSVKKGETLRDTARNLEAMGIDAVVVRHSASGVPLMLSRALSASVINAGDGSHEHPTQGLLDVFTIRELKGRVKGLTVAIVGDIAHSRVARSNIWGLTKLGARVILVGPSTLVPTAFRELGCEITHNLDDVLPQVDVINMLRIQFERLHSHVFPGVQEYARLFGLNAARLARCKPDVVVMHPGPINRGLEMAGEVADGPRSAILRQVSNGLAVRMAVLYLLNQATEAARAGHR
jgi:aspartate carbamoyltransferase catalytic subunit